MAVKDSKWALTEAAALLKTDKSGARMYFRRVQLSAGNIPYRVIVAAMRDLGVVDIDIVAAHAARLAQFGS